MEDGYPVGGNQHLCYTVAVAMWAGVMVVETSSTPEIVSVVMNTLSERYKSRSWLFTARTGVAGS